MKDNSLHYVVLNYLEGEYRIDVFRDRVDKGRRVTEDLTPKPTTFCWWYDPSVVSDYDAVELMRQAALEERYAGLRLVEEQITKLKEYPNPMLGGGCVA